jgi:hypothetical protein
VLNRDLDEIVGVILEHIRNEKYRNTWEVDEENHKYVTCCFEWIGVYKKFIVINERGNETIDIAACSILNRKLEAYGLHLQFVPEVYGGSPGVSSDSISFTLRIMD